MLTKARGIARNDIGVHRKIAEQVNNSFKLSRITKIQKLEFLLILEEFVKNRFHAEQSVKPRICERNDYKMCIDTMKTLTSALSSVNDANAISVAISVLTPPTINFGELEHIMYTRLFDPKAIHGDLYKIRQQISNAESRYLSSRGSDVSLKMNVAKIISRLENENEYK